MWKICKSLAMSLAVFWLPLIVWQATQIDGLGNAFLFFWWFIAVLAIVVSLTMIGTKDIWVKERRSKIHHYVSGITSALEILAIAYIGHFGLATILAIATLLMAAGYSLQYKLMDDKERV